MKKFLSLVLALVMTMSLVTVSAGAKDFTDDDKITYEEAVNVISTIGVVDGYADGSFNPQGSLTRGAAAKIICNMILGPTTAAELHADTAPYKDVPTNHTFAGYIAYCAKEGIISGYADGTFRPAGTLTGYAFMKMLLGALGYDAEIEQYTGANWSINVAKKAINIGLNKSLEGEFNGIKAVNREEACLYAFNTLKADLVEYENILTTTINGQPVNLGRSQAKAQTWNNSATRINNIKRDEYIQFAEQFFTKLELEETTDVFGRPSREWTFKGEEIGTYVNRDLLKESYTEEVTGKDLYNLLGKSTIEDYDFNIYIDGETEKNVLNYEYKNSKGEKETNDVYFTKGNLVKTNDKGIGGTDNGVLTEVYVDTDAKEVTIAIINTYVAVATKDYDSKKEVATFEIWAIDDAGKKQFVKNGDFKETLTASVEDYDVEDIEKDDIVLVNVADGEIQVITDPEVIEETEISAFKKGSNLTVDGEKYKYASTCKYDGGSLVKYTDEENDGTINLKDTTYNVILDPYGFVIGVEEIDPEDNYVFITGYDGNYSNLTNKTADVGAIFLDGTMKTIEVNVKKSDDEIFDRSSIENATDGTDVQWDAAILNTWCTYTVNDEGVYTLKIAAHQNAQDVTEEIEINKKHISLDGAGANGISGEPKKVYGNDDTVYLNVDLDAIYVRDKVVAKIVDDVESVTTGVKSASLIVKPVNDEYKVNTQTRHADLYPVAEVYTLYKTTGNIIAAVTVAENDGVSSNFAYVTSKKVSQEAYDKSTKEFTWTREVVIDGKLTEISYVGDTIDEIDTTSMKQGNWYEVKYFADGTVKSTTKIDFEVKGDDGKLVQDKYVSDIAELDLKAIIDTFDTIVMEYADATHLTYKNGSLWTNTALTEGFSVSPDVKVVLCNADENEKPFDEVDDEYEGYDGLEEAIEDMNGNFKGTVNAIIEDGIATSIILNCTVADDSFDRGTETGESNNYKVELAIVEGKLNLVVTAKQSGEDTSEFDYVVTAEAATADKVYTIADDTAALAGGAADTAASQTIVMNASVGSGLMVYTATVELENGDVLTATLIG